LKVATVRSFALNRGIVTDITPVTFLESEWKCNAFHSIKAVVSQVGALLLLNYSYTVDVGLRESTP